jgi:hypothetical protein
LRDIGRWATELAAKFLKLLFKLLFFPIEPFLQDRYDPLVEVPKIVQ